jgi:limonene-1,2-epoxide hydrolase
MMADAKQVVLDFCKAWEALDQQRILDSFTDDGVYHNMPMAPATGKDAIKGLVAMILAPASAVTFEIKRIAVDGDTVLTERIDTFKIGDKTVTLDVMGAFDVRDGKIAAWRDFFDLASWTRQTTA